MLLPPTTQNTGYATTQPMLLQNSCLESEGVESSCVNPVMEISGRMESILFLRFLGRCGFGLRLERRWRPVRLKDIYNLKNKACLLWEHGCSKVGMTPTNEYCTQMNRKCRMNSILPSPFVFYAILGGGYPSPTDRTLVTYLFQKSVKTHQRPKNI